MSIQIIVPVIEQGNITSSGNQDSYKRVRSVDHLFFTGSALKAVITAQSVNGKAVLVNLLGYETSESTSPKFDLYWYESGHQFDLTNYSGYNYLRIVLKYEDGSDISPSDISACELSVEIMGDWIMGEDGFPTNTDFIDLPESPMEKPYPMAVWRIEPGVNDGFPFNELLPLEKPSGAFMNAHNLEYAYIPRSCKKIGEFAFTNTKLRRVRISADCKYYPTSFPKGCEIEFYNESG